MKNKFSSSQKNAFDTYPNILANQSDQDHSTESDKESDAVGLNGSGDIDVSTGNGAELQTKINKKQLAGINDPVATPDFLRLHQEKEQHILDILSTSPVMIHGNDLHMFPQRHPNGPNKPTHASNLRLLPTMNEAHNPHVNSQFCGNVPMPSDSRGKSIDYFEDLTHGFAAIDSLASTRAFSQPSSSNFPSVEVSNRSFSFMPQSSIISISGQALQNQPYYHLSPMGFRVSDRRQTVGVLGERCMDGEFYGLPLNSRGELIQVSSSGRVGVDHMKKSTMLSFSSSSYQQNSVMSGSFSGFASEKHPNEQGVPNGRLDLLPIQKKHNVHLPPQFSVAGLPNTGRLDAHSLNPDRGCSSSVYPFDSNLSSTNISLNQCRQYIQSQNENQMAHMKKNSDNMSLKTVLPTMRLMGKDVAVGRSNTEMQSFEDGNIWMDKEIIQEHRPSSNDLGRSLLKRQIQQERILCPALEKSKETLHLPLEFESNQASQSNFQMKAQEFRASHPFYNWKTSSAFQNGDLTVEPNSSSSELHPTAHPFSLDMLYKGANLQDYLISGAENAGISSQVPVMSTLLNTRPHMGCRPTELNYQQNLPNARKSAFDFPFLHPDYNEHNQSSSFPTSSKNLPPWSVHASPLQVKTGDMASKNFSDVGCTHHPSCTSGTNFLTPLYHSSVVSDPHSSVISGPPLRSSLGSVLFIEPPGFPFSTGVHSNSSIDMSYRDKIIIQERMKSNSLGVKVPDHCQKIKKRPAAISSGSLRPTKMPNLMQEDLSAVTELTRETSSSEIWQNIAAYEARSKGDKGIGLGCCSYEAQKNGLGTSSDSDFSKADTLTKPGPMKLTAGAKHILKPSQKMDHDNSRLIHSTIPFPGATDCESFLDSQRKSTMIYRF
ncbi:conserved hypothetical protein [Ricinus communis]|uniref:Uncharacterized protein n=1 Tax=Ricinus communis TaxID=3988 RepID=B9S307_RICCO|nr:conserved hypothetical protein [Ricinus communis]